MNGLKGFQKRYLRGLGNGMDPVIMVGRSGLTPSVVNAIERALSDHELIKLRFIDHKGAKKEIAREIEDAVHAEMVGMVGHTALFFRRQDDPEKRSINLPER